MRVAKAVFPAAGLGTRFLPATKAQPKEMLPLVDKPLIQYVVEEAVEAGIRNITIVTGRGKNAIEDHFDVVRARAGPKPGERTNNCSVRHISNMINVSYVRQKEALGLGHAILVARDLIGNEPFAVMLGDDIIDSPVPCMKQMIDLFEKLQASIIATCEVPRSEIHQYGVIRGVPVDGFNGRVFRVQDRRGKTAAEWKLLRTWPSSGALSSHPRSSTSWRKPASGAVEKFNSRTESACSSNNNPSMPTCSKAPDMMPATSWVSSKRLSSLRSGATILATNFASISSP